MNEMSNSRIVHLNNARAQAEPPFYEKHWFKVFGRLLAMIIGSIPPLKRYISKTIPYLNGRIPKLYRAGNYIDALDLSLSGLIKCDRNNIMDHYWWWSFMSYAVYCAHLLENPKVMNPLIKIAHKGFEPYEGRNVAYCFCMFSHFKYSEEDYDSAIRFAELAKKADDDSGEAYYLLGYYELFLREKDPVELFNAAVKRDHDILGRIVHHPSLKQFPNIIAKLKELHLLTPEQSPNQALSADR